MTRRLESVMMPLPEDTLVLHPEMALLDWDKKADGTLDIGRLCYVRRRESQNPTHRSVDVDSLCSERVESVRKLITCLSELQTSGRYRPRTVHTKARKVIDFVNWADKEGFQSALTSKEQALAAMQGYFNHLRDRVSRSELKKTPASTAQSAIRSLLADLFEDDDFGISIRRLQAQHEETEHTSVPDERSQGLILTWANELFNVISVHLIEFKPYPFFIQGPSQRSETMKKWLWPCERGHAIRGFNQVTGEVRTYAELKEEERARGIRAFMQSASRLRLSAANHLKKGNEDPHTWIRIAHAHLAMYCFAVLLLAETGANLQQLLDLKWDKTLADNLAKQDVVRQGFREIKWRAGGKKVTLMLSVGFLPLLRRFLEFRNYLLSGVKTDKLFFLLNETGKIRPFPKAFLTYLYDRLAALQIELPRINAREWRAAKDDWAQRNHGPVVAAKLLGHTLQTAMASYAGGTEGTHREEMTAFLGSLEKMILRVGESPPGTKQSAVGSCIEFEAPKPISPAQQIKPTCRSTEGCLFCHQYRIHADEVDIRKLLSCRYCVRLTSNQVVSLPEYENSFGVVLRRIEFILEELKKRDTLLVARIEEDVDINGNLDPFWTSKLEQLFELGIA